MNNFEKIKQMNIDEMAEFFAKFSEDCCMLCGVNWTKGCCYHCNENIKKRLLQEVGND